MLIFKSFLRFGCIGHLIILQLGHIELLACRFNNFFLCFLKYFPKFDIPTISSSHFKILALRFKPSNINDFLIDILALKWIKRSKVRLKLSKVVKLMSIFLLMFCILKDDDPSSLISKCYKFTFIIKFQWSDNIFF